MTRRTSNQQKELRGTSRQDRQHNPPTSERLTEVPPAPRHLSSAAAAEWDSLARILISNEVLTGSDLRGLELLAAVLASEAEFAAIIKAEGVTIESVNGTRKAHPALAALTSARAQARVLLLDFGLVPRGRGNVDKAPPAQSDEYDPLDEFADPADKFFTRSERRR